MDVPLINWWLYTLIVAPVTFGIYSIVVFFKRTGRVDKFIVRKRDYYRALLDYTGKYTQENNTYDLIHHDLADLMVTMGLWGFIWLYKMNRVWYDLQKIEQDFDDKLSQIWIKAGLIKYPLTFNLDCSKNRSYILYFILSIVTFGIWGLVWDYKIHTDPDNIYKEFHSVEDTVLQTVRTA